MVWDPGQKKFDRSLSQTYLLILESLLERQRQLQLTLGTQTLVAAILGACSTIWTLMLASAIVESSL